MIILGLTGSIGMGKSTAAAVLRGLGARVCDSDAIVRGLTRPGGAAVPRIAAAFPGIVTGDRIDRRALAERVFSDPPSLRRLESILHPMVEAAQGRFLRRVARDRVHVAVLDIPLLFETGADARVDRTLVVTAPYRVQRARVLRRPGMTPALLDRILARQMPDVEKCRRADIVIRTGLGKEAARRALTKALRRVKHRRGRHWPPRPRPLERHRHA